MTKKQGLREGCRREGRSTMELVGNPADVELSEPKKRTPTHQVWQANQIQTLHCSGVQMWKVKARLAALELPFHLKHHRDPDLGHEGTGHDSGYAQTSERLTRVMLFCRERQPPTNG